MAGLMKTPGSRPALQPVAGYRAVIATDDTGRSQHVRMTSPSILPAAVTVEVRRALDGNSDVEASRAGAVTSTC